MVNGLHESGSQRVSNMAGMGCDGGSDMMLLCSGRSNKSLGNSALSEELGLQLT
jgi:hypothetical protein